MEPNNYQTNTTVQFNASKLKPILAGAIVILILFAGYLWFRGFYKPKFNGNSGTQKVKVEQPERIDGDTLSIPAEFPSSIPVEASSVFESYKTAYPDRNITQYTVSYTTSKSKTALWDLYMKYFNDSGISTSNAGTDQSAGTIYGVRENRSLLVAISPAGEGKNTVRLNYLVR